MKTLHAPGPAHGVGQPFVGGAALVLDAEAGGDAAFARVVRRVPFRLFFFGIEAQRDVQHFLAAAAEQRQRAVRGNGADASRNNRSNRRTSRRRPACRRSPSIPPRRARCTYSRSACSRPASSAKRSIRIWRAPSSAALASATPGLSPLLGGERPASGTWPLPLPGSASGRPARHRPAAPGRPRRAICALVRRFGLYGRYRSSSRVLSSACDDRVAQFRRQLALLLDRGQDRRAALFQFAQIAQALFQQAQLDVVQAAGRFLAVAGDEGHGGAFVQQGDGGGDLGRFGGKFERRDVVRSRAAWAMECEAGMKASPR